jgi:hypothetical protein
MNIGLVSRNPLTIAVTAPDPERPGPFFWVRGSGLTDAPKSAFPGTICVVTFAALTDTLIAQLPSISLRRGEYQGSCLHILFSASFFRQSWLGRPIQLPACRMRSLTMLQFLIARLPAL